MPTCAPSPPLCAVVAGRLLCDTYLAARDLVHEVDYTLTTLARNLLKQERAELSHTDIPGGCSWGRAVGGGGGAPRGFGAVARHGVAECSREAAVECPLCCVLTVGASPDPFA